MEKEYKQLQDLVQIEHNNKTEPSKYHWNKSTRIKWTITYFVGVLLVYSVRSSISICAIAIGKDFGWNKHVSGMVLSAFFCGYITTNVLGGYLADRYGGEIVLFYTGIGWATLTMLLPVLAQSQLIFRSGTVAVLFIRFFTGVTQGVFFPSLTSIFTKHVPIAERAFVFSFAYSGSSVGTIATGFVGSIIIEHVGWPTVFILIGLLSLVWVVWVRYLDITHNTHETQDKPSSIEIKEPIPWRKLVFSVPVWALFIGYFCQSYCFFNLLAWTPVYFHDAFPESKGWVFNVIPWLFSFIIANSSGYIANHLIANGYSISFIRKSYGTLLYIGLAVFSLMLTSVESFNQALLVMSLTIGVNAFSCCSVSLNSQDLAPKHAGALHGFMNSNGALAGFIGVYITGHILESTNSWSSVFISTSVMALIGFFAFVLFGSAHPVV